MISSTLNLHRLLVLAGLFAASGCSPNCVQIDNGGVIVDVRGVSDCKRLTVFATDTAGQYPFDAWPATESDGGTLCSFLGLVGRTGTYTVSASLDGVLFASQPVSLENVDACNITGKLLEFEVNEP